jgi:hypothetical protein
MEKCKIAIVITHGFCKRGPRVDRRQIETAKCYRESFLSAPDLHTYREAQFHEKEDV